MGNKNAPRFREALCVLLVPFVRLLHQAQTPHGGPGGSSHGHHTETVLVHDWAVFYACMMNWSRGNHARIMACAKYGGPNANVTNQQIARISQG